MFDDPGVYLEDMLTFAKIIEGEAKNFRIQIVQKIRPFRLYKLYENKIIYFFVHPAN